MRARVLCWLCTGPIGHLVAWLADAAALLTAHWRRRVGRTLGRR